MTREEEFQSIWAGRIFQCTLTGEKFTIPDDVYQTAFYQIGRGFVDVGRLNCYSRFSNIVEVKEEEESDNSCD